MASGTALRIGTLYSGIGGSDLGFERAGAVIAFQAEIDQWRLRVLAQRFPRARQWWSAYAALAEEAPVDLLYASPPSRDPQWLEPLWERAAKFRSRTLVIEGPVGASGVETRRAACERIGYDFTTVGISAEWAVPWGTFGRSVTFTVCWPHEDACPLRYHAEPGLTFAEPDGAPPQSIHEWVEASFGFPAGWACVCGATDPGLCADSTMRLVAVNECCPPALTHCLASRLVLATAAPALVGEGG